MNNRKRIVAGFVAVLALAGASITAFAVSAYSTPAEAVAGITKKTVEEVTAQRQEGTTYGAIAAEAGKLEEFKQEMQELYKKALEARVADGRLTQEQADQLLADRAERLWTCDGFGTGAGAGGLGLGNGRGVGRGTGGRGIQNGACMNR